ncbi:hypothetical protein FA15DRAFT_590498 [Coprinopsis marcescibilis]|uniref:Uncharacterized protein n=1 Tax=Coprinopsis marcescibilis TaxID=230819 RepID=A0A5C3KYA6_COPMA|nr:hypothetical protein FA15DRAFT_590498 [Coprinopsis marcescibilis]
MSEGLQKEEEDRQVCFDAYKKAWAKCLDRIQAIARRLLDPVAGQIVKEIEDHATLTGLPHPELPIITVTNPAFRGTFLYDVSQRLDNRSVHLYPSDCHNAIAGMRSLIAGFLEGTRDIVRESHRSTTSVPNYDIKLLVAWYKEFCTVRGNDAQLIVILHDFEVFDTEVMQDIFYICSQHVRALPLVFILSMSSPVPLYLNIAYPRSILKRLRIRKLTLPGGVSVLNTVLLETFFSVDFQPDVILGPIALQYIADFYLRYNPTFDSLITNLQLMHMKHFSIEPLTSILYSTPRSKELSQPEWSDIADDLLTRLAPVSKKLSDEKRNQQWKLLTPANLPNLVEKHRKQLYSRAKAVVVVFNVMKIIQLFLVNEGYKGLGWDFKIGLSDILVEFLQNNVDRDVKDLSLIMRKMSVAQVAKVLPQILDLFSEMEHETAITREATAEVEALIELLKTNSKDDVPNKFSEWATSFFKSNLVSLEENPLWEIWYTGLTPFPSELINPSIRATMISGLLRPHDFTDKVQSTPDVDSEEESLWQLPDTSILFKRYLDSGKMINVYDWFESFQSVLEVQKTELQKAASPRKKRGKPQSPRKLSAKTKGKQKQQEDVEVDDNADQTEEEWKLEVQARFIRALHELDYLGFIKHTKRKADHVIRTVFEVTE